MRNLFKALTAEFVGLGLVFSLGCSEPEILTKQLEPFTGIIIEESTRDFSYKFGTKKDEIITKKCWTIAVKSDKGIIKAFSYGGVFSEYTKIEVLDRLFNIGDKVEISFNFKDEYPYDKYNYNYPQNIDSEK